MVFLISAIGLLILDQLAKLVFLEYLPSLVTINQGIIFGLGIKAPLWLIIIILILILIWALKAKPQYQLGLALIFGGGLSNFLDRLARRGVIDFDIKITAFNLADIAIVAGVLIVVCWLFKKDGGAGRDS